MKIVRLLIFIVLSMSLTKITTLSAQSDLRNDSVFFNLRIETLNEWLTKTGVGQVFYLNSIKIKKSKLEVLMLGRYKDIDSLTIAWNVLKYDYDTTDMNALYRKIFNLFAFEFELGKDSLILNYKLNKKDAITQVYYNKKKGVVIKAKSFDRSFSATRNFKTINVQLEELAVSEGPVIEYAAGSGGASLKTLRKKINEYLADYYSEKGTFWYNAKFEILKDSYNELTFEVTQLSKEILNDRNYFEYIRIELKLEKKDNEFNIKIDVMGKYSGGFGFLPRRSEYRNMETDFGDYTQRYQDKLALKIKKLLTNEL